MQLQNLNLVPEMIRSGKYTEKQILNLLAEYIQSNYPIFGLHKYDEDFRIEIITIFLERGHSFLNSFQETNGNFFSYFYCNVHGLIKSTLRKIEYQNINELIAIEQSISDYSQTMEMMENGETESDILPETYAAHIDNSLSKFFTNSENKIKKDISTLINPEIKNKIKKRYPKSFEKIIIILALKSAYNLSDGIIENISRICGINFETLQNAVLHLKNTLIPRVERKKELENRRNTAYYHHKKYEKQMDKLKNSENPNCDFQLDLINEKYERQTSNWEKINERLSDGYIYIRPTNKAIANILGICERQVNYYIHAAKEIEPEISE